MTRYIFVVGGVMSGIGKGVATSSIASLLQNRETGCANLPTQRQIRDLWKIPGLVEEFYF